MASGVIVGVIEGVRVNVEVADGVEVRVSVSVGLGWDVLVGLMVGLGVYVENFVGVTVWMLVAIGPSFSVVVVWSFITLPIIIGTEINTGQRIHNVHSEQITPMIPRIVKMMVGLDNLLSDDRESSSPQYMQTVSSSRFSSEQFGHFFIVYFEISLLFQPGILILDKYIRYVE